MVELIVPQEKAAEVSLIYGTDFQDTYTASDGSLTFFLFSEVNYGNLWNLPELQSRGIPYTSKWEAGAYYGPGEETCRFTPEGDKIVKKIYDSDLSIPLRILQELLHDPTAMNQLITKGLQDIFVLPWDKQVEYGRIYRAKQLITGPNT